MKKTFFVLVMGLHFTSIPAQAQRTAPDVTQIDISNLNRKLGELTGANDEIMKLVKERLENDPEFLEKVMSDPRVAEKLRQEREALKQGNPDAKLPSMESLTKPFGNGNLPNPFGDGNLLPNPFGKGNPLANPFGNGNPFPPFQQTPPPKVPPKPVQTDNPIARPVKQNSPNFNSDAFNRLKNLESQAKLPSMNTPELPPAAQKGVNADLPNNPMLQKLLQQWETNVGPLDKTPELKEALIEFFKNKPDLGEAMQSNQFWNDLTKEHPQLGDVGQWLSDTAKGSNIKFSGFKGGSSSTATPSQAWSFGFGGSSPTGPSDSSGWSGEIGWGIPLVIAALVMGYVIWRKQLYLLVNWDYSKRNPLALEQGAWPIDPWNVRTRDDLVRAFEHISLKLCGQKARVWNHFTIAAALRRIPTGEAVADDLAHLYELARYSPPSDPLAETDLGKARDCLCQLAGVRTP